eukprot:g3501.t1
MATVMDISLKKTCSELGIALIEQTQPIGSPPLTIIRDFLQVDGRKGIAETQSLLQKNDVITHLNSLQVKSSSHLAELLRNTPLNSDIHFTILRPKQNSLHPVSSSSSTQERKLYQGSSANDDENNKSLLIEQPLLQEQKNESIIQPRKSYSPLVSFNDVKAAYDRTFEHINHTPLTRATFLNSDAKVPYLPETWYAEHKAPVSVLSSAAATPKPVHKDFSFFSENDEAQTKLTKRKASHRYKYDVFLKHEEFQKGGSFKIRGMLNAALIAKEDPKKSVKNLVTHSSGNMAQAVAIAAQQIGVKATCVVPQDAVEIKKRAVVGYGANMILVDPKDRAKVANEQAEKLEDSLLLLNNNANVLAGHGTIGIEIASQMMAGGKSETKSSDSTNPQQTMTIGQPLDVLIVPVGSGGMIAGITIAMKTLYPNSIIIGAQAANANDAYRSKKSGIWPLGHLGGKTPKTVADGIRTTMGKLAWPTIRDHVDDIFQLTEKEILAALKVVLQKGKLIIEPTSAVGVACLLFRKEGIETLLDKLMWKRKGEKKKDNSETRVRVGIVLCGGNVDWNLMEKLWSEEKTIF